MSRTPDHLSLLESSLASLAPIAGLNRDRLMYEAGRQSAPMRWHWPILAAAFAGLSAILGQQLMTRPEPELRIVERVVPTQVPIQKAESPPLPVVEKYGDAKWGNAFHSSTGYLSRRDQALYFGSDSLQATPTGSAATTESLEDLKDLLHRSF